MLANEALGIKTQQCGPADALINTGPPAPQSKVKFPSQESLLTLHQLLRNYEMRILQGVKHVIEDRCNSRNPTNIVEWVFEVRVCSIKRIKLPDEIRCELLIQLNKSVHGSIHIC